MVARYVEVRDPSINWATAGGAPTVVTFPRVHTPGLRLDLTSAAPGTPGGAQRITDFTVSSA